LIPQTQSRKRDAAISLSDIPVQIADIRIFLAVVAAKGLAAASRQLDIAPMQVTRRLSALEDELGVRLLHRTTRSVSLTAEGEAFLPYATAMLEAEESAKGELGRSPSQVTGHLKVSAPTVFGQSIIVPLLGPLLRAHPALRIELELSDRMFDIVAQGFDLAIRIATLRDSELVARRIADNPRVLCASPDYLRANGTPRNLAELDAHECIQLSPVGRWPFTTEGELIRRRVQGRVTTSSVEAARSAALQGLGIAMLTYWDLRQHLIDGHLVEIKLEDAGMEPLAVWAVTPTRRYVPARVKVFLDALEQVLLNTAG